MVCRIYINSEVEGNIYSGRKFMQRSVNATKQGMWGMYIESHGKMHAAVGTCKVKRRKRHVLFSYSEEIKHL